MSASSRIELNSTVALVKHPRGDEHMPLARAASAAARVGVGGCGMRSAGGRAASAAARAEC